MELDRKTLENDEEYLRQISEDVDFSNDDYKDYINKLKLYCLSHSCYALAPVQIGIPKRIIYVKNSKQDMSNNLIEGYDESIIYINPVIIASRGLTRFLEGCESVVVRENDKLMRLAGVVDRPYSIDVEYYDINKRKHKKTIEGFEATVFSHEFDHLNGILHIDKTEGVYKMSLEDMKEYRSRNPYKIISKK